MRIIIHKAFSCDRRASGGFSLVELMVAVALGLILLTAMLEAFNSNSATGTTNTRFAEVQSNARFVADYLKREIQLAGYANLNAGKIQKGDLPGTTITGDCSTDFAIALDQPIFGVDDSNTGLACIPNADYAGGDVLVIRKASNRCVNTANPFQTCPDALAANTIYIRSEFMQASLFKGTSPPPNLQPPYDDFRLDTSVYYVAPCSNLTPCTSTGGDGIPTLKRVTLGAGPAMTAQVVAAGIENLQVQYGVQYGPKDVGTLLFKDASAMNAADWPAVVEVRLWVLARSTDAEFGGFTNTSQYDMGNHSTGNNPIVMNDHYVRQMHALVVNVRK